MFRHSLRVVALLSVPSLSLLTSCGGKRGTINLDIVLPVGVDPFRTAASVRFTLGMVQKTAAVTNGTFNFTFEQKPPKTGAALVVEAIDFNGTVLGYGQTPPISLTAGGQNDSYGVWVSAPGTMAVSTYSLPVGRTELAAFGADGLGAEFAGGRGADGVPVTDSYVFDVFTSTVIQSANLTTARAGAVAVDSAPDGIVFGGDGVAANTTVSTVEQFDPTSGGQGVWQPVAASVRATSYANLVKLGNGTALITGGVTDHNVVTDATATITTGSNVTVAQGSAMTAARVHHAVAATTFPSGPGAALVIGGLPDGSLGHIAETFTGTTFTAIDLTGVENRWYATATPIGDSGVLLVGGTIDDGTGTRVATNSIVYIPTKTTGVPVIYAGAAALKDAAGTTTISARAGHTATLVGGDILLCGGYGADGKALTTCEIIAMNGTQPSWKRSVGLAQPRRNHVAVALQTGIVLVAGGVNDDNTVLGSVEIYTPDDDEQKIINVANGAAATSPDTAAAATTASLDVIFHLR